MALPTPEMLRNIEKLENIIHERQYALITLLNNQPVSMLAPNVQKAYMNAKRLLGESYLEYAKYTFELDSYHEKAILAFAEAYQLESNEALEQLNMAVSELINQNTNIITIPDESLTCEKLYLTALAAFLGCGEAQDASKGFHLLHQAASKGSPEAQIYLGIMYRQNIGVLQNDEEAFKWNTLAMAQGSIVAMYHLVTMHLDKTCFYYDEKRAYHLLRQVVEYQEENTFELALEDLHWSNDHSSLYKEYHALMHQRHTHDAANLIVQYPELLEEVICFDAAVNEYYNSNSPSDISSMMIEFSNIKQFGLLSDLCFRAATAFNWKISDHLSPSPDPLEHRLSDCLSKIDVLKMSHFNAKTFDELLNIYSLHLTRITDSDHMDANSMRDKCLHGLLKCICVADSDELRITDSSMLMFLASTLIQALYRSNNRLSLSIAIDHSDIMILVMTLKHRPTLAPHQLNILLGKDLVLPFEQRLMDQSMMFYHQKQTVDVDESLSDLAPEHRTRG